MTDPSVEIRIVVDNLPGEGLVSEHGLSLLVRGRGRTILLDTGQGTALAPNAAALGVDLSGVDALALSHGHYDHTGGIPDVVERRQGLEVYLHTGALRSRFTVDERGAREIGMPASSSLALERLDASHIHPVTRNEVLGAGIGVSAAIERTNGFEDTGGAFFLDAEARIPDPIEDDLAVWIRTDQGLVVLVGCCHAGIVNTLDRVRSDADERRVRAIIGGLHLLHAEKRRLEATVAALESVGPQLIVPCHCTGTTAVDALRDTFGARVEIGQSGKRFRF